MALSLGSDGVNKRKRFGPVDDDNRDSPVDDNRDSPDLCSICYESFDNNSRTLVTLKCSHKFHLDCIVSAFNAKGSMQCPYCKQTEPGEWRYMFDHFDHRDDVLMVEGENLLETDSRNSTELAFENNPLPSNPRSFENLSVVEAPRLSLFSDVHAPHGHQFRYVRDQLGRETSNYGSTSNGSSRFNDNGIDRFNEWEPLPSLESLQQEQDERDFHHWLYGGNSGGGDELSSGGASGGNGISGGRRS